MTAAPTTERVSRETGARAPRRRPRTPAWSATLTWKAAVFITLMCCGLAALLGGLVHDAMTRQTIENAREKALTRLDRTVAGYETGSRGLPGEGVDPPELPAPLRDLAARGVRATGLGELRGKPVMWAAGPADHGRVLGAAVDHTGAARALEELDRAILGSSGLAIGGTLCIGALGVTRITRRLHQTAAVARRISAGDLDARVADSPRHRDEVTAVSTALDTMAATLQRKLESERRFTADVAHELRTPLTGLNAAAELLPPGRPAELVRDRVGAMRSLTEDLLEISRLDTGTERPELAEHDLAELAARAVRGAPEGTALEVRGDPVHVTTDRRRLERVLGNLIANAHKHGATPVTVTVESHTLTVTDSGPGYPAYLLTDGPQRFRTEGTNKGHGLGLTIATGQAAALDATLTLTNPKSGGARAEVVLRPTGVGTAAPPPPPPPGQSAGDTVSEVPCEARRALLRWAHRESPAE
ncbi:sensor histidine kinase [Streptomyces sp. BI20]|uniref:sensor histidine kinase n=1 Tax=Streptomyces sp. BI20 TaxID=3403460 RepID=UPI003C74873A